MKAKTAKRYRKSSYPSAKQKRLNVPGGRAPRGRSVIRRAIFDTLAQGLSKLHQKDEK